ncbi:MAG: extradiol ring-cleavage dioxygenase [Pseudolabrys sp.]|nr:extradiol ring-cleavage dioxygenase [Pseudolabrys sp.]
MAKIVAAYGLPHTPFFPSRVEEEGPQSPTGLMFGQARDSLAAARPDVILIFDTDHYNTFFFDNFPILAIGIDDKFVGPVDEPRGGMTVYTVPSAPKLADYLHQHTVRAGYDVASLREFVTDHSVMVPLHFVNPDMRIPVIPVFISGHVPPLPPAQRCFDFGRAIRTALEAWPENLRVAIIGTGSFSLEVFGPRIDPGKTDGVPDPDWVHEVCRYIEAGDTEGLIAAAVEDRMHAAGNVGGELLNWIAMFAFTDNRKPDFLIKQMENGHAYAGWRWE